MCLSAYLPLVPTINTILLSLVSRIKSTISPSPSLDTALTSLDSGSTWRRKTQFMDLTFISSARSRITRPSTTSMKLSKTQTVLWLQEVIWVWKSRSKRSFYSKNILWVRLSMLANTSFALLRCWSLCKASQDQQEQKLLISQTQSLILPMLLWHQEKLQMDYSHLNLPACSDL